MASPPLSPTATEATARAQRRGSLDVISDAVAAVSLRQRSTSASSSFHRVSFKGHSRRSQLITEILLSLRDKSQSLDRLAEQDGAINRAGVAAEAIVDGEDGDEDDNGEPQWQDDEIDVEKLEGLLRELTTVVTDGRKTGLNQSTSQAMVDALNHVTTSSAKLNNAVLQWEHSVHNILVIKKRGDANVAEWFGCIAQYLVTHFPDTSIFFPPKLFREDVEALKANKEYAGLFRHLHTWKASRDFSDVAADLKFDLVICLGGDGTLLHMASMFQQEVPPVMCFALGSLGFLTTFDIQDHRSALNDVMNGGLPVTIRMRLKCQVLRKKKSVRRDSRQHKQEALLKEFGLVAENATDNFHVLNELVIDRGPSPYLTQLDLYIDDEYVTCIQGDGLIVATPTGSTAYSAAAGGSMVHPSVACVLLTPVCAHNVTSRPIVIPAGAKIQLTVAVEARSEAFAAFDGRNRQKIGRGESVVISSSPWPVPCITPSRSEWFRSLHNCLGWNQRSQQQPLQQQQASRTSSCDASLLVSSAAEDK
eukprot:TRINITY_DN12134_c0_g2_i1.p1 TRINITY_DN12134_c0_g2~~TRINITY_DN12134_c0_g2_i1.p1  ORF type:complete len:534 (+),score=130.48 TRINITY_DN12134_c0_g2_i1:205-1806(+)